MPCKKTSCARKFTQDYYYVGGFYGACNEAVMRVELVKNGPIAVSFEVYKDFMQYKVTKMLLQLATDAQYDSG